MLQDFCYYKNNWAHRGIGLFNFQRQTFLTSHVYQPFGLNSSLSSGEIHLLKPSSIFHPFKLLGVHQGHWFFFKVLRKDLLPELLQTGNFHSFYHFLTEKGKQIFIGPRATQACETERSLKILVSTKHPNKRFNHHNAR